MKYEFHVGDYVETVGGFVGWVSHVDNNYITIANNGTVSGPWLLPDEQHNFIRIGQYDFTKTDQTETIAGLTYFDETAMLWKINELVKAVNELRAAQKGGE